MSKMKSKLAATLLTLVLAVPAFSGVIGSPGGSPPPPPPPGATEGGNIVLPGPQDPDNSGVSSPVLIDILIALLSLF